MFKKLFDKINEIIETINQVSNLDEITVEIIDLIKSAFTENFSDDMKKNEELFDKIMGQKGLWTMIGKKIKKALRSKEELIKFLLYVRAVMSEFERRYYQNQKENRRNKEIEKIIDKYTKLIKEVTENKNLSKTSIEKEIKKLQLAMQKEIKNLDFVLER